ncbi:MAG: glutathione binding-like protein [Limnohabitans sp.]
MVDLYVWPTPNGYKISMLLEELAMPYRAIPIDIGKGEQFEPGFLKISPNNKMPAIVDPDGPGGTPYALFESGAILMYLAGKVPAGEAFFPKDPRKRHDTIQWLMFKMGGLGPMLGQAHHFRQYAPEQIPYAVARYTNEAKRLYGVMDKRLGESPYLAGDFYSIADIATFPWTRSIERQGHRLEDFPNVKRWFEAIDARPATKRGLELLAERRRVGPMDEKQKEVLFGATQYAKR